MKKRFLTLLAAALSTICGAVSTANAFDARVWRDDSGTFELVGAINPRSSFAIGASEVFIVDDKGRQFRCSKSRLSESDRQYLDRARMAYESQNQRTLENLDWAIDESRLAGTRRVVDVDGLEYAFRWIPAGEYAEPTENFDPNVARSVAATRAQSRKKSAGTIKSASPGFWMLETEVTLEMFNQFVSEAKYQPGPKDRDPNVGAPPRQASNDPYAEFDAANAPAPTRQASGSKKRSRKLGYSATPQKSAGVRRGDEFTWKNPGFPQTKKNPVTLVTRADANAFCDWLSAKTGRDVSLPTTDQWYLAAQPGKISVAYFTMLEQWIFGGSESWERGNLPDANYPVICPAQAYVMSRVYFVYRDSYRFTVPVGSFKPNGNGLYDMVGNVGEMTSDNPNVVESRGGSWFHLPGFNPLCWVYADSLGYDPLDRAIRDYEASKTHPSFAELVAQDPYDEYVMPDEGGAPMPTASGGGQTLQVNPFASDASVKPFVHVDLPEVEATCFTGFRVVIQ